MARGHASSLSLWGEDLTQRAQGEEMRAVLVQRVEPGGRDELDELEELVGTMGYEVVGRMVQEREADPAFQIGRGKVEEVAGLVRLTGAELVVFANQLTPSQLFNLEKRLGVRVMDRFQLILEIFAKRAGSPEAKLQVEYARLSYELPRLRERIRNLLSAEQPGFRGRGEYELNLYLDMVKRRMALLRKKLRSLAGSREKRREQRRRRGFGLVALAGYTNAGKSTLLNSLTGSSVEVDDRMFTTLTARTRALRGCERILITDSVGFIEGLPPWMVEAFKAVLEEIYSSDLVLLVVDGSDPMSEILRKLKVSLEILSQRELRILILLNKMDLLSPSELEEKMEVLGRLPLPVLPISAKEGRNLDLLVEEIRKEVFGNRKELARAG